MVINPCRISAYSGSYSFNITRSTLGAFSHSLANKTTRTTVSAGTFNRHDNSASSTSDTYRVTIRRNNILRTSYRTSEISANNGTNVMRNFGTVNGVFVNMELSQSDHFKSEPFCKTRFPLMGVFRCLVFFPGGAKKPNTSRT